MFEYDEINLDLFSYLWNNSQAFHCMIFREINYFITSCYSQEGSQGRKYVLHFLFYLLTRQLVETEDHEYIKIYWWSLIYTYSRPFYDLKEAIDLNPSKSLLYDHFWNGLPALLQRAKWLTTIRVYCLNSKPVATSSKQPHLKTPLFPLCYDFSEHEKDSVFRRKAVHGDWQ